MQNESRHELKISGAGSASGGMYSDVVISGAGSISGDVDCVSLKVSGAADVNGNVIAQTAKISGATTIKGSLEAQDAKISGHTDIQGNMTVKDLKITGSTDVKGNVSADEIEVKGMIKVKGDCEAEAFTAKGTFTVGGLLNAGTIDVRLYGNSSAREIGGEKISISAGTGFSFNKIIKSIFLSSDRLTADSIEGDDIFLEYTKAKVVRGNNVNIGQHCDIDLVEYRDNFQQSAESKVKEHRQVNLSMTGLHK